MKPAFFKLLCEHEFYNKVKHKLVKEMFVEDGKLIYETLQWAQEEFKRDLSVNELHELVKAKNPTLTRANKTTLASLFEDIEEAGDFKKDTGTYLLQEAWRKEIGRQVGEIGIKLDEGELQNLTDLRTIVERHQDDFIPNDKVNVISSSVTDVMESLARRSQWRFNVASLAEKVPALSGGEFGYILARPEVGKTAWVVNMIAGQGGFADQGARVLYMGNEEPVVRTIARSIYCYTGMTMDEVKADIELAQTRYEAIRDKITWIDETGFTLARLDSLCRRLKPDIVVVDQLDKLSIDGQYESDHSKLGAKYEEARNIAKRHDLALYGISQASAEAEGHTKVTYASSAGSKTSKSAEGDLILGIGMQPVTEDQDYTDIRYLTVSKNKLSGWHGTVTFKLVGELSRCLS